MIVLHTYYKGYLQTAGLRHSSSSLQTSSSIAIEQLSVQHAYLLGLAKEKDRDRERQQKTKKEGRRKEGRKDGRRGESTALELFMAKTDEYQIQDMITSCDVIVVVIACYMMSYKSYDVIVCHMMS